MHPRISLLVPIFLMVLFLALAISPSNGQQTPNAPELISAGDLAFEKGEFRDAVSKFEAALQILNRENDSKAIAGACYKLGRAYNKLSRYPEALRVLNEALSKHEAAKDQQAIAFDLVQIAYAEMKQGNYKPALEISERALKIHTELGNKKGMADACRNLSFILQYQGDMDQALRFAEQSFDLAKEIDYKQGEAISLKDLAGIHWKLGNLERSLQLNQQALSIAEEIGDRITTFQVLGNTGTVYWHLGDLHKALEFFSRTIQIAEEIGNLQGSAITLLNIGSVQMNLGNYKESRDALLKSLEMAEKIPDKGLVAACLDDLGVLERLIGNYDAAMDYNQRAIKITREIGEKRSLAYGLKNLGLLYASLGNYNEALKYLKDSLPIFEELQEKRGIASILNEIGYVQETINKTDEALQSYTRACVIAESIGTKPDLEDCYNNTGSIYLHKGETEKAEGLFSKSIQLAEETGHTSGLMTGLYKQGLLFSKTNRPEKAVVSFESSIQVIERVRADVEVEQRASYLAGNWEVYEALVLQLAAMRNFPEAFEYAQKAKARSFLDLLAEARIDPQQSLSEEDKTHKKNLITELMGIQDQIEEENEKDKPDRLKIQELTKKRATLEEEYSSLILQVRARNPLYADIRYHRPLKLADAQSMLDDRAALLEYFVGKSGSLLFVVTRNEAMVFPLSAEAKLVNQVRELRETLQKPDPVFEISEKSHTRYVTSARSLYADLIQPAAPLLKEKARLLIAPDGVLNYLPFEVLVTGSAGTKNINFAQLAYLEKDFAIHYIPSASVLAAVQEAQKEKQTPSNAFLALADPTDRSGTALPGATRSGKQLSALPNARTEVREISNLYPGKSVSLLIGKDASEFKLKQLPLDQYRRIHFACHGYIDEVRPQFSALVLGTESGSDEDGYLTMREVFDLKLNSDLVVLSACGTGLGKQLRGEGVTGLTRAFLLAGTPSVVVSLWNVNDKSSAVLMTAFYKNLEQKQLTKVAALQEARLKLIESGNYSHPYYWAPFILIGNP